MPQSQPIVIGIDAGGTMTDTILVDQQGGYTIGKAATTPHDESLGFIESADEAAETWGLTLDQMFPELAVVLYSGTGMVNTLLSRTGRTLGLITTRGMEDMVLMGRGLQAWASYSYADRLHAVTHQHPEPLVPRERVFGVTERVDQFGKVVIPVYEHEAEQAAHGLIAQGVDAVCICTLFSHVNPAHEQQIGAIVTRVAAEQGVELPVYHSHEIRPVIREQSRLNSVLIEAYACAKGRQQLVGIEDAVKGHGFRYGVQTMLSYGGLASVHYPRLHETMISGPIGGILGAKHVGDTIGTDSIIVSDMGGTSFDMGVITHGQVRIENEPIMDRFKLNVPTIAMDTIGAGAGMIVKVDPVTHKVSLGPESAGADPGPVCFDRGNLEPTVCDCDAILGRLNPDYFLGGKVKLNVDKAKAMFQQKVAEALGVDLYDAAEGMVNMLDTEANSALRRIISSQGVHPSEFTLLSYGGSGPLHLAGYSRGIGFKDILTFQFAAAFSAFGCTTADYLRRHSRSVHFDVPTGADEAALVEVGHKINAVWRELTRNAVGEMEADGHAPASVECLPLLMMRYTGQLEDVEVRSPVVEVTGPEDMRKVLAAFEDIYTKVNHRVSRYGDIGVSIMELGLIARTDKVKPRLIRRPLGRAAPDETASRGRRAFYHQGQWHEAQLWEMDLLLPGNEVTGPAIVEHPATTLVIPPGDRVWVDEWTILHYQHA